MNTNQTTKLRIKLRQLLPILLLLALCATAQAELPPVGSVIGNQATATYLDASLTFRTATSNLVETTIQQVAGVTLTPPTNLVPSGAGALVFFAHVVTNDGNGNDSFTFQTADVTAGPNLPFVAGSIKYYADLNSDGIPDNLSTFITQTTPLGPGASYNFVVGATIDPLAASANTSILNVTAVSTFLNTVNSTTSVDTAVVSNNAVIALNKSISPNTGPAGGTTQYTVTLRYTNSGNLDAADVVFTDQLPPGMSYVPSSGLWSVTGADALTDDDSDDDVDGYEQGTAPTRIGFLSTGNLITATIETIPVSFTGEVTFKITIDEGWAPGNIFNVANVSYDDGVGNVGPTPSNTVPFLVTQAYGVTIDDDTVALATQGSIISFTNTVTNNGNGTDTFNITLAPGGNPFPAGTSFILYKADGSTPLTDSNGDGIPDTGPLPAGTIALPSTYDVIVKATLPPSAATGTNFTEEVTAQSVGSTTIPVTDTGTDTLSAITANEVDLTSDAAKAAGLGVGAGPEGSAVVTNSPVLPGTTTLFELYVHNESTVPDTFNLSIDPLNPLPVGWSVSFTDVSSSVITGTGSIAAGAYKRFFATVSVPTNAAVGTEEINFRVLSPTSGASDIMLDAVVVPQVRSIQLTPNNSGQVVSGGTVIYSHTLTNLGNVTEGGAFSTVNLTALNSETTSFGANSTIYHDTNGDGVFNTGDSVATSLPIALTTGASTTLFIRVVSAPGTDDGTVNTTTVTATTVNGSHSSTVPDPAIATDSTSVLNGDIEVNKEQAIDADFDGVPDGPYGTNPIADASPGEGIRYRITVTNTGLADVTSVVFRDTTPPFTTYYNGTGSATLGVNGLASWTRDGTTFFGDNAGLAIDTNGLIRMDIGALASGESVTVYFGIRIDSN